MVSTMLDGMLARSIFLRDFNMHETVEAFKRATLLYLGHHGDMAEAARPARRKLAVTEY
jgi:hypothetical protein